VRPALLSWVLLVAGCNPPLEGAACRRDDECPSEQTCTESCACALGERRAEPRCTGFVRVERLVTGRDDVDYLDANAAGDAVAVWDRTQLSTKAITFDGVWRVGSATYLSGLPSFTPVALESTTDRMIDRNDAGVTVRDLSTGGSTAVWFDGATAVRLEQGEAFASLAGKGLFRKQVGQSPALEGTRLDAREAVELEVSQDRSVIAARFGAEVATFPGPRTVSAAAARFTLAANGSTLAVLEGGGLVQVLRLPSGPGVPIMLQRALALALDGPGGTLAIIDDVRLVVYRESDGRWAFEGTVPTAGQPGAMTFSGDGRRLFVALRGQAIVEVYELLRR
jgi:hypothetical protein